jgi:hypothetical protein
VLTAYAEAVIAALLTKVELQNLLIGTACNVKRWLRILAVTKIDSKTELLPFGKSIYWIPRFFRTIRLSLNLVSWPGQIAPFLTQA